MYGSIALRKRPSSANKRQIHPTLAVTEVTESDDSSQVIELDVNDDGKNKQRRSVLHIYPKEAQVCGVRLHIQDMNSRPEIN
jgi:hypothetical protein